LNQFLDVRSPNTANGLSGIAAPPRSVYLYGVVLRVFGRAFFVPDKLTGASLAQTKAGLVGMSRALEARLGK
jgi:hypothetical protein